jgi:hypothetical protein
MKKIIVTSLAFVLLLAGFLGSPTLVSASPASDACDVLGSVTTDKVDCDPTASTQKVSDTFRKVINILSIIVGAVCVLMIIIGGFRYIISGGDSNAISGAKNTILYAIIGLLVVLFARTIALFVYQQVK